MKLTVDIKLTPRELAQAFCDMDDEAQAQFFIDAADIASGWKGALADWQWHTVGKHLLRCECSTDLAREMVTSIAEAITE